MKPWQFHNGATRYHLGFLPSFLSEVDPRSAKEQFDTAYRHGGGWTKFEGFKLDTVKRTLNYPGDPPVRLLGSTTLREEKIMVFEYAWVAVVQPDDSYEVARMD